MTFAFIMLSTNDDVDALVTHVHAHYAACKFKLSNDYQHTVLAAFVLHSPSSSSISGTHLSESRFKVAGLATGAKCLPTTRYPPRGDALHDSHAEVLARRAFVRWLYEEAQLTVQDASNNTQWIERRGEGGKWQLRSGVRLHMYISTVPCGDASMRFLASQQDPIMAALKDSASPVALTPGAASRGRDNYSLFGVIRTKPGRADSPPTLCMSCSDKIGVFNVLGVQGALAANIFEPVYLSEIIIGDVPENLRDVVREDCERALYGRLEQTAGLPEPYRLARPTVHFTDINFLYSRTVLQALNPGKPLPLSSNESLCWYADSSTGGGREVIINGIRRGVGPKQRRLAEYQPRLCKLQLFKLYEETARVIGIRLPSPATSYHIAKQTDGSFQVARSALKGPNGIFPGWLISGKRWESFDSAGIVVEGDALNLIESRTNN